MKPTLQLQLTFIICILIVFNQITFSQTWITVDPSQITPQSSAWENTYQSKINLFLNSEKYWGTGQWDCNKTNHGDQDNGKRFWPLLLAQLWQAKESGNNTEFDNLILNEGNSGIYNTNEGSFYKPFTAPGYCFYYFKYKNDIQRVDNAQLSKISSMWSNPNKGYTQRVDGKMDPIYICTEFNSENFDWMGRIGGYALSHVYESNTSFWDTWIKNWVRGTFNAGRVEYESHTYTGFCIQAASVVYQFSPNNDDKLRARAVMDWIALESALKYLNGHYVGPESRNKASGWQRMEGSIAPYLHLWFAETGTPTGLSNDSIQKYFAEEPAHWTIGFLPNISYRPPQAIIDIAQRKFNMPVEIHSAKPYYGLDESNYSDYMGATTKGRRYEFETMYLHTNYSLGSMASGRPKAENCFSEQRTFEMAVKDLPYTIWGEGGDYSSLYYKAGRDQYEQIAQLRNVVLKVYKGGTKTWFMIPPSVSLEWNGNNLRADLGNGVYLSIKGYNITGKSTTSTPVEIYGGGPKVNYNLVTFTFNSSSLAALAIEIGTQQENTSYANFKTQVDAKSITNPATNQVQYISTLNNTLKVEFSTLGSYTYKHSTAGSSTCQSITVSSAGNIPKAWYNGTQTDYTKWKPFEVVYGDSIVKSDWGGGYLMVKSKDNGLKILVNNSTAAVTYQKWGTVENTEKQIDIEGIEAYPNPCKEELKFRYKGKITNVAIYSSTGSLVKNIKLNGENRIVIGNELTTGTYILKITTDQGTITKSIIKL